MVIKSTGNAKKIILLFLLIIFLLGSTLLAIDFVSTYFGLYFPLPILNTLKQITINKKLVKNENPLLLEKEELSKDNERLNISDEQLAVKANELASKESDIDKKMESLKEKENELDQKEAMLDQRDKTYNDVQNNVREQAIKLYNMPPKDAVAILEKQSESDIVDILRALDKYSDEIGRASLSPFYLKLLGDINKDKAGTVLRMIKYPAGNKTTGVETLNENETPPNP